MLQHQNTLRIQKTYTNLRFTKLLISLESSFSYFRFSILQRLQFKRVILKTTLLLDLQQPSFPQLSYLQYQIFQPIYVLESYQQILSTMFSGLRRGLKSIDFYQAVPSQLSQGTVSGACISIVSMIVLSILVGISVYNFTEPRKGSDLIIDQQHLDQKLKVNIDISFPKFPCSMLSLDIENILKVHEVNIKQSIRKYTLPQNVLFVQSQQRQQRKRKLQQDFKQGKGCRMIGTFFIDRVPGNFHFSCHGYTDIVQEFLNEGGYRQAHKTLDLSHVINYLWFGEYKGANSQTFKSFQSHKQIGQAFLGISYTYFLDIVQFNQFNAITEESQDSYLYTARMNQVILAAFPMVYFKYETNPITVFKYSQYAQWHQLFVQVVGIIGGIFTVATILDGMVHSSIHFLIEKHRLGKLK